GQMANDDKLRITDSLLVEQQMRNDFYKLAVNLEKSLTKPGCADDVILRDGDRLIVEETRNTVKVSGNVPYPNAVPYTEGKGIRYYMGQAGARGSKNRKWAYIIYQNGSSAMVRQGAKVEPGCEIVLPERNTTSNSTQNVTLISSMLATLATLGAVVVSALK
ncbi:MAG: capsule biosynthesis protein, partial [Prevotellaceae bacterium]|nr:capsule biosynthesis protein [Prevotellaceae bacterium]